MPLFTKNSYIGNQKIVQAYLNGVELFPNEAVDPGPPPLPPSGGFRTRIAIDTTLYSPDNVSFSLGSNNDVVGGLNYEIFWGDGTSTSGTTTSVFHAYPSPGKYIVYVSTPNDNWLPQQSNNFYAKCIESVTFTDGFVNIPQTNSGIPYPTLGYRYFRAWFGCENMIEFGAATGFENVTDMTYAWNGCGFESFPPLVFGNADFQQCWNGCVNLKDFPPNMFNNIGDNTQGINFYGCALTPQSIENILVSCVNSGQRSKQLALEAGTNAGQSTWTTAANNAYSTLQSKSWNVSNNS